MKAILAFVATCCLANSIHGNPVTKTASKELTAADYRLKYIEPEKYKIDFVLEEGFEVSKKFKVTCEIKFKIKYTGTPTADEKKQIRIHYALDWTDAVIKLVRNEGTVLFPVTATLGAPHILTEIAVITADSDLIEGDYTLTFTGLIGTLRDNMSGFYMSEYMNSGVKKYVAATQFQSTDARAAFPCFDEPALKATFDISITAPKIYTTVLGNTEGTSVDPTTTTTKTTFLTTPKMSTYLVAFIVSTFKSKPEPPVEYAIFFPEGKDTSAEYASEITSKIVTDLETKLKIKYNALGNAQLYQAAIPDFSAGAMENWGLATYRESALLWDPTESSARNKQRVCSVIAHELAHMWFGDYVTTHWWSDTFLNEGFARYFEYHTTANVETDFDMKNQFVVEQQQVIFNADAVLSALPLSSKEEDIFTPKQIESKFSTISYNKGGSVFRMIERVMGETEFLTALSTYLTGHATSTVDTSDLEKAFELQNIPLGTFNEWFTKSGYPVVTVTKNGNDAELAQQRFLLDGEDKETKWNIPLTYDLGDQPKVLTWMYKAATENTKIVNAFKNTDIFILNLDGSGYYRVNYEKSILEKIILSLGTEDFGKIPEMSRAILIDDTMNMARVELQTYNTALDLTKYLAKEEAYYPWVSAYNNFAFLIKRLGNSEAGIALKSYVMGLSTKLLGEGEFIIEDKHMAILKKVLALQWACELGNAKCIETSKTMMTGFIANPAANPLDANLRSIVYCNAIRNGGDPEWTFLFTNKLKSATAHETVTIINALGCSKDETKLTELLTESLYKVPAATAINLIRKQDAYSVLTAVLNGNAGNVDIALKFVIANYDKLEESYADVNALPKVFSALTDRFTTAAQGATLKAFLENAEVTLSDEIKAAGLAAVTTADANIVWTAKIQETFRSYFGLDKGAAPAMTASVLVVVMAVFMTFFY